jgi:hypothetical protein
MVLQDPEHFARTDQLIWTCKPLVDAIGNLESRDASLADCMLEILRCARTMIDIGNAPGDSMAFMYHAKATFNSEFEAMNTETHFLCLFLHPLCRHLAISNMAKSRKLTDVIKIALGLVQDMGWSEQMASRLVQNIRDYSQSKGPFAGGLSDGEQWWESLMLPTPEFPIRSLALTLFAIVPHAAEVERLFSSLGGIQSVKRSRLTVQNFEMLGMLRNHYSYVLNKERTLAGKPTHRHKLHVHTRPKRDLNVELVAELDTQYTAAEYSASLERPPTVVDWTAPLEGPESILLDEIEAGFGELERQGAGLSIIDPELEGNEIIAAEVYDLEALKGVDQGQTPQTHEEDIHMHRSRDGLASEWDPEVVMSTAGVY